MTQLRRLLSTKDKPLTHQRRASIAFIYLPKQLFYIGKTSQPKHFLSAMDRGFQQPKEFNSVKKPFLLQSIAKTLKIA
jgi:hypothetical protein